MNKTEQCRELLKQLVDDQDNEKWLPVTTLQTRKQFTTEKAL